MGIGETIGLRTLVLVPVALCLVVMIASNDIVVRALTIVPLTLLVMLRDIVLIRELDKNLNLTKNIDMIWPKRTESGF